MNENWIFPLSQEYQNYIHVWFLYYPPSHLTTNTYYGVHNSIKAEQRSLLHTGTVWEMRPYQWWRMDQVLREYTDLNRPAIIWTPQLSHSSDKKSADGDFELLKVKVHYSLKTVETLQASLVRIRLRGWISTPLVMNWFSSSNALGREISALFFYSWSCIA